MFPLRWPSLIHNLYNPACFPVAQTIFYVWRRSGENSVKTLPRPKLLVISWINYCFFSLTACAKVCLNNMYTTQTLWHSSIDGICDFKIKWLCFDVAVQCYMQRRSLTVPPLWAGLPLHAAVKCLNTICTKFRFWTHFHCCFRSFHHSHRVMNYIQLAIIIVLLPTALEKQHASSYSAIKQGRSPLMSQPAAN